MPRLVAVSKKQPIEKVTWAYRQGVRHFGENYVQDLLSKAKHVQRLGGYSDIKWHFIGHLQRKKTKLLTNVPGLWMVETLDSVKTADSLNRHWALRDKGDDPLRVLIQINTSNEDSKHGVGVDGCLDLVQYIRDECEHLHFAGLMTIGRMNHQHQIHGPNPDFMLLWECRKHICSTLELSDRLELSMGMSADYEHAVELGSTNIRIGTALFGERPD